MTQKRYKTLERPTGNGRVCRENGEEVAKVFYNLQVGQEFLIARDAGGSEEIPGLRNISGQVTVIEGERDLMTSEETWTLHLSDGRYLKFFASRGNPVSGTYQISPASGEGLVSDR